MANDTGEYSDHFNEKVSRLLSLSSSRQIQQINRAAKKAFDDPERSQDIFDRICIAFLESEGLNRNVINTLFEVPLCDEAQVILSKDKDNRIKRGLIENQKNLCGEAQVNFSEDPDVNIMIGLAKSGALNNEVAIMTLFNRGYLAVNRAITSRLSEFKDVLSEDNLILWNERAKKMPANSSPASEVFAL